MLFVKKVVAIDGPSGAGKSTIAKMLAHELGFDYLDTGALYRAVALHLVRQGLQEDVSDDAIAAALKNVRVAFRQGRVMVDNADVSAEIRSPEASHSASVFSARKPVREYLLDIQRDAARHADIVAEGRDMTTVVFPQAYRKFYLDATVDERTRRRTTELLAKGYEVQEERIRADIIERDERDAGRDIAPLRRTDDACFVDSTGLNVAEVFSRMLMSLRRPRETGSRG